MIFSLQKKEVYMTSAVSKRSRIDFEEKPKSVLIYRDAGICESSIQAIAAQFTSFKTKIIDSNYLLTKSWEKKACCLVMGGGHCSFWEAQLGQAGMIKIQNFVAKGGKYLGICAGAYFAAATSIFRGPQLITKQRPIGFYQGTAAGPLLHTFDHLSPEAALAVKVNLLSKKGFCYYQGGCSFDITETTETTRVLARFCKPYYGSAIIACTVGLGKAVLCGLHPEFSWKEYTTHDKTIAPLAETLSQEEGFRQEVWKVMLQELF